MISDRPIIIEVEKVSKEEAIKYCIPFLREIAKLDLPYKITNKYITIKIPYFLPKNRKT